MKSRSNRRERLQRIAIVAFAATITGVMGVRAPQGRATSFADVELQGMGRAVLTVEETEPAPTEGTTIASEVFARMIYASELSSFGRGLYVRSSFTLPATRETGVLIVDVDRSRGQKQWAADAAGMRARFYTLASKEAKDPRFDGVAVEGSVELTASIVGAKRAGFRLEGSLTLRDRGDDQVARTADDGVFVIALTLESVPAPEEIAGQPVPDPPAPPDGYCDPAWCWQDDGYYDGYWYGPGCGETEVGYETTDSGCESDTIDDDSVIDGGGGTDGVYDPYDPYEGYDSGSDGGCGGETTDDGYDDSSGCEGSDDSSGTSSDGCDGGDSSSSSSGCDDSGSSDSGCSDSGSSSGCGDSSGGSSCGSGCEGDTLERAPVASERVLGGDVGWIAIGMFLSAIGVAVRGRRDGDEGEDDKD